MRLFNITVYNSGVAGTTPVYSQPALDVLLGSAEKLAVQVVCVCHSGTDPTLRVVEECSEDGVYWYEKATLLATTALSLDEVNLFRLSDDGSTLHGGLVRLRFEPGGTSLVTTLTVYVCGRTT